MGKQIDYQTTWRHLIEKQMKIYDENWEMIKSHAVFDSFRDSVTTVDMKEFDRSFDYGFGNTEGMPFTVWTSNRVYFPVSYDGLESVMSVPRHPCSEIVKHDF